MGGRGGSGGRTGGGSGFTAPAMTGSEKQVSYAKDIIENPYKNAMVHAQTSDRLAKLGLKSEKEYAAVYRAAASEYKSGVGAVVDMLGAKASAIIDKKSRFRTVMNALIDKHAKEKGVSTSGLQHI